MNETWPNLLGLMLEGRVGCATRNNDVVLIHEIKLHGSQVRWLTGWEGVIENMDHADKNVENNKIIHEIKLYSGQVWWSAGGRV